MADVLRYKGITARIEGDGEGRRTIVMEPPPGKFVQHKSCVTAYPLDLIERVLRVKEASFIDEILRDEAPLYVENNLKWSVFSYVDPESFANCRLLDFGCGSGASVMVLARMLPKTAEFVGVDLMPEYVDVARQRAKWYGIENRATFLLSPGPNELPEGIGSVDFILLSAVYEHLLPGERRSVLPLLWSYLKPEGTLFLDQTPYRWLPIEKHTTGIPLLNYLPDSMANWTAHRFSKRVTLEMTWGDLLRRGIRGGTTREILGILGRDEEYQAELLAPTRLGVRDPIDLWVKMSSGSRRPGAKRAVSYLFRALKAATGVTMIPSLSLAVRKRRAV